ncbi:hypothetical protein ACF07T_17745 [Streptomyces sp. NPDC015184]
MSVMRVAPVMPDYAEARATFSTWNGCVARLLTAAETPARGRNG